VLRIILTINSDCFPKQSELTGLRNVKLLNTIDFNFKGMNQFRCWSQHCYDNEFKFINGFSYTVAQIFHCRQRHTTLPPQNRLWPCFRYIDYCFTYLSGAAARWLASCEHGAQVRQRVAQSPPRRKRCGDGAPSAWFYVAIVTSGRKERIGLSHRGAQSRRFSSLTWTASSRRWCSTYWEYPCLFYMTN
jgi:hypothetical protein